MIRSSIGQPIVPPIGNPLSGGGLPWDGALGGGLVATAPANTVAPVISSDGSVIGVGETLTSTNGTWTGSPAPTYTYQWQRGNTFGGGGAWANIGAATASTYAVVSADVGFSLKCVVTATNAAGSAAASSNTLLYLHATDLAGVAVWVSQTGVTQAAGTASAWASAYGSISCTLTAPAGTNEPAYNATGGVGSRPLLTFDGTDNVLQGTFTKGSQFTDCECGVVGSRGAFGTAGDRWLGYTVSGSAYWNINDRSTAKFRFTVTGAGGAPESTTDPDAVNGHYSGDMAAGGTLNVRTAGAVEATFAGAWTNRADGGIVAIGAAPDGTVAANIALQAAYHGPLLTAGQRTNIRALLGNATGISC